MLNVGTPSRIETGSTLPARPRNGTHSLEAHGQLVFEVVTERSQFDALESEWNTLFANSAHSHQLFQSFNWNWHWCNHYLNDSNGLSLSIVIGRRHGRIAMIWPLVCERSAGLVKLSWMGDPVSQYGDVLVEQTVDKMDLLMQGWDFISKKLNADYVYLRKVREDAEIAAILEQAGARTTAANDAPYLDLTRDQDFDTYQQHASKKTRRTRRRKRKRLDERGALTFAQHDGGAMARQLAAKAIHMKWDWLKQTGQFSRAFADERILHFFCDVAEGRERPPGCRLSVLYSAEDIAAIEISVFAKRRAALHVIVYEPKFEQQSPGILQLEDSFRHAFAQGLEVYDLLAPTSRYKKEWSNGSVAVKDLAIAFSLRGKSYVNFYICGIREAAKQTIDALPANARQAVASAYRHLRGASCGQITAQRSATKTR